MNKTNIEWCDVTWNPIVGCKHGCTYCYAKQIVNRFKHIPEWTEPQFFEKRLSEPGKEKKSLSIFVGSMSDVLGDWIPVEWIQKIIDVAVKNPHHKFLFLTKNPKRYSEFLFPENCHLGTTIDYARHAKRTDYLRYKKLWKNKTFVSVEPLLSDMSTVDFTGIDLVIVGAQTGAGAVAPKKEWIDSIKGCQRIFYKENIKKYL